MLNLIIGSFENSVGSDQLASQKPADQNQHCVHSPCKCMPETEIMPID